MRRTLTVVAVTIAAGLLGCSSGPEVEMVGGNKHPFPKYLVELDSAKLSEKKTGEHAFSTATVDLLENRYIFVAQDGADARKDVETWVSVEEGVQKALQTALQNDPEGSPLRAEKERKIKESQIRLADAKAKAAEYDRLLSQNEIVDCKTGWRLIVKQLEGGEYTRKAEFNQEELDSIRETCYAAKLAPKF